MLKDNLIFLLAVSVCLAAETCYDGPGGASPTEGRAGGHNIQVCFVIFNRKFASY